MACIDLDIFVFKQTLSSIVLMILFLACHYLSETLSHTDRHGMSVSVHTPEHILLAALRPPAWSDQSGSFAVCRGPFLTASLHTIDTHAIIIKTKLKHNTSYCGFKNLVEPLTMAC